MTADEWVQVFISITIVAFGILGKMVWGNVKENEANLKTKASKGELESLASDLKFVSKTIAEQEEKNYYVRHNFDPVTKALQNQIISENAHTRELIQTEMRHISEKLSDTNKMIEKLKP